MSAIEFLTSKEVAKMFGLKTPLAAVKLMQDWKVPSFYLGAGRCRGYRWKKSDVLAAVDSMEVKEKVTLKTHKKMVAEADAFWSQDISKIKESCARM